MTGVTSHESRVARLFLLGLALVAGPAPSIRAQNPDLMLSQSERDSILKTYDNIFPILGRKAIERGFDLPKPLGLNLIGLYVDQNIAISNLGLSTGDNPIAPASFIGFGTNTSSVTTFNARADLWVFPFLNVYVIGGKAWANTTVEVTEPITFTSSVDQTGTYVGTGITGAMGIKQFFVSADVNWTWTKLEKLDKAVNGRIFGLRFGKNFKIDQKKRFAFWVGAMKVSIASETVGSINLSEAIPPETVDRLRDALETVEDEDWYQNLGPVQKGVVDQIVDKLLSTDGSDLRINYSIDKSIADPWNMLVGANFDFNKRWTLRSEAGFIGRNSILLSVVYRLDL
ncbi:MAG TPA: hypothetical protein VJU15_04410 [Gemmatimonadales bacterium]|nr:hypothetical protein [Gemmatimonadales bacterium]